ncbi:MAG: AbrB/MazE/SpoVT family DNA-binding domain-containing protein [Candidatus Hodarchaeota archaeon]
MIVIILSYSYKKKPSQFDTYVCYIKLDERGRITIPKEWRENLQLKRAVAIRSKHGILLIPLSIDPLSALKGAFTTENLLKNLNNKHQSY